ncbi:MAG TPA: peptidyl-prolyl cis-trans isomerase [Terriglobales bacterium]|nr:peptidyl-prolyl cis-trans isomerase [Terriglobales bacterium]
MIRFLQQDKGKKIFAGIVVFFLVISMVMYLGGSFTDAGSAPTAGVYANVAGEQITVQQVADSARRMGRRVFPNGTPEFVLPELNKRAADQLVVQAALMAEAQRMGLKVTDEELKAELRQGQMGKQFFPDGNFIGQQQYTAFVQSTFNMTVANFEKSVKSDLLMRKLISVVQGAAAVTDDEVQKEYQKQNVKVKLDYAVLTTQDLAKKVPISQTELKAYFDRNKAQFASQIPEHRKARYVVVDPSSVTVQVTEDDYKRAFSQRQEEFRQAEQVDVRHILVKTEAEALDIKKKLEAGAKFEELAKKHSEDPGSKDNGGLYKGVVRNQMVPEFDKVAFSLAKGKISDPVKTSFGYHVLRVDAHREAALRPLEEVKPQLEAGIRAEKSASQLDSIANKVYEAARKEGLDKAAAANGLKVIQTDYFAQGAALPGVGNSQAFMQQVFSIKAKSPVEKIALEQGVAVAEVTDVKPASTINPTFEEQRARIESLYRNERASTMLTAKTQELADRAHSLNNLKQAAKEMGATVKTSELVTPGSQVPDLGAMSGPASVAFNMKPGQISDAIVQGPTGAVVSIVQRQEPTADEFTKQKEQLKQTLVQQKRMQLLETFAETVRSRMAKNGDIQINAAEEKRLMGALSRS